MASAAAHIVGRQALAAAWPGVTGRAASLPELQIAGAQADFEGGYGLAPYTNRVTGERAVLNNYGAIQGSPHTPPCGPDSWEATDTHADGTPYQGCYRRWPTPDAGAAPFIRQITIRRPTAWRAMRGGDVDGYAAALRARDPESGTLGYYEATAEHYAAALAARIPVLAAALAEPIMARRGGPVINEGEIATGVLATGVPWRRATLAGALLGAVALLARWIVVRA